MRTIIGAVLSILVVSATMAQSPRLARNPDTLPAAPEGGFRFVVISDLNSAYGSTEYNEHVHALVRRIIEEIKPSIVVSAGDLVAGQKRELTEENLHAMWRAFDEVVVTPLEAAGIGFFPVPGNHDASGYPAFAREVAIYRDHWTRRARPRGAHFLNTEDYPSKYSFTAGGGLFVALDITTLDPLPESMWAFLDEELRRDHSLKFCFSHIPPYPVTIGRERETIPSPDDDRARDLMLEHGVTVWFTAHHHGYFKGHNRRLNLVALNCAGNGPRRLIGTESPQRQSVVVVDLLDGRLERVFAVMSDGAIFDDLTLPLRIAHDGQELLRFDQEHTE
ncbi:MAG TPA: metallophosphoesterase [Tepidisphaeraceae bacterium]|nr:metallophosphoesterase [Tepidisphaeraceae bacterium]